MKELLVRRIRFLRNLDISISMTFLSRIRPIINLIIVNPNTSSIPNNIRVLGVSEPVFIKREFGVESRFLRKLINSRENLVRI